MTVSHGDVSDAAVRVAEAIEDLTRVIADRADSGLEAIKGLTEAVRAASVPGLENLSAQQRIELAKKLLKGTIEENAIR